MSVQRIGLAMLLSLPFAMNGIRADTIQANSCSDKDVAAAVKSARDGDIVLVPSGTCRWSQALLIADGITLQGAGIDKTIIVDGAPGVETIQVYSSQGKFYRISGFTFQRGNVSKGLINGTIFMTGTSKSWRVDHIKFDQLNARAISVNGFTYGVIDHCEFINQGAAPIIIEHGGWNGYSYGDGSWADDSWFGTEKFVFVEDNLFRTPKPDVHSGTVDSDAGGRYVFRHNVVINGALAGHGTESGGRKRGMRAYEVYANRFSHDPPWANLSMVRAGTGVFFDNVGEGYKNFVSPRNFRSWDTFKVWPACDGSSPYDVNDGVVYATGTHTGGAGATTLTDATKKWKVNEWSDGGYSVRNITKAWGSYVTANTATTIELEPETHGSQQTWDPGDIYQVLRATICLDQVGRGKGSLLGGFDPLPLAWPNQISDPLHQWNNKLDGKKAHIDSSNPHIKEGRDFFNDKVRPGYTPYVYPHPLVSSSASGHSPNRPTNLVTVSQQ